ncbi:MAG: hypothetical protein RQ715_11650 [Methylococcales bacterium]|nr:hypothetical protein [Methylococcales bacterium]
MLGGFIWLLIEAVLIFIPVIGEIIDGLLLPVAYTGFVLAAQVIEQDEKPNIKTLFLGITKPELLLPVLSLGVSIVLYEVLALLLIMVIGPIGVALFALPMGVILFAALVFAVPAVALDGYSAWAALKLSFTKAGENVSALLMVYLVFLGFMVLSVISFGIALIAILPLICCSFYVGYRAVMAN